MLNSSLDFIILERYQLRNSPAVPACPPGFTLYEISRKCYALINIKMNKDGHIAQCTRLVIGAHIAAPLDAGEDLFIQGLIKSQLSSERQKCESTIASTSKYDGYYLGAESCERKFCKSLQWVLSDGFRQKMVYSQFANNQPDCGGGVEHCVHYWYPNFGWNDIKCEESFCSVCEYRLQK